MQDLNKFWELVQAVWTDGFAGVDVGRILTALMILLGFLMLRGLFTRFVMAKLRTIAQRTTNKLDDNMVEAMAPPLRMVPLVLGVAWAGDGQPESWISGMIGLLCLIGVIMTSGSNGFYVVNDAEYAGDEATGADGDHSNTDDPKPGQPS